MRTTTENPAGAITATRTELQVSGMTCQNCVRHAREALEQVPGVRSAVVSLPDEHASVRWQPDAPTNVPALLESLEEAGYPGRVLEKQSHGEGEHECHSAAWESNLWIGVAGMLLLMIGEWVFRLANEPWFRWSSFLVATIVQVFAGARFYRGALNQLRIGQSNMDTLVALGSTTAYLYSVWALFSRSGGHLYFMEAAAIISLISLGHWLEAKVSATASRSLELLLHLAPKTARRSNDGVEEDVSVEELRVGDRVVLRPGDHVPTDCIVIDGNSALDESMLTGESMPVEKAPGAVVYAGTINLTGHILCKVTATGEGTALAGIIAAVEQAQTSRANIQRLGDRVSSVFVPIVVVIALATALFWALAPETARALHNTLAPFLWHATLPEGRWAAGFIIPAAVLIVACPCAMGIATPAAIMAASNAASRKGILIRDGVALEKAGSVTAILFDKTGTLTAGRPKVVASEFRREGVDDFLAIAAGLGIAAGEDTRAPGLALAAALGSRSNHPLSQAVAALAPEQARVIQWVDVHEIRGAGVEAKFDRNPGIETVRLGSLRWLRDCGVPVPPDDPFIARWSEQGATIIALAANTRLLGVFALEDTLKPEASAVVQKLSRERLKVYLVTGDNQRTARSIARQVGIRTENVLAEVRPEEKAAVVKRLQESGERVAFVGDGINDAPALEQADLGLAVTRASDVAREAADIILLNSEIGAVPESLSLARATLRIIKQNLFWAFFYNALGIPLAALGFMSPILCAAAMGLSDIVVIGNALRLLRR
jgi:Cu+-exporting ATPase